MISIEGLTKYYGKTKGIENLDLTVKKGEVIGLLGPNGAGKTTTIRVLMGLLRPDKGKALIENFDCWSQSVEVKKISGYIPGDIHLYHNETGSGLINMYSKVRGSAKLAKILIERFDFNPVKKVKSLSRGNRQKLAIILAFMFEPKVLILDEPTSGLDPIMQQEFYSLIKEFEINGATIFISSHFLPEVEKVCQRVGIIKDGALVGIEEVDDLSRKHVRVLNVTFEKQPDLSRYKMAEITDIKNTFHFTYQMKVKGHVDPVIKALSHDNVHDLSFEHASLEEIFLEYYS